MVAATSLALLLAAPAVALALPANDFSQSYGQQLAKLTSSHPELPLYNASRWGKREFPCQPLCTSSHLAGVYHVSTKNRWTLGEFG